MGVPSRELIDQLYREEVLRARAMSPDDKFWAGVRLFDLACKTTADGIRQQHPEADEAEVRRMLAERLALGRRLEQLHASSPATKWQ